MARNEAEDDRFAVAGDAALPPEDPRLRAIRRLVTALLAVLLVGSMTVVGALLIQLRGFGAASPTPPAVDVGVRPGERLLGARIDDGRLILLLSGGDADSGRAILLDAATLAVLGSARLTEDGSIAEPEPETDP